MAVADAVSPTPVPPTPTECSHPAPVEGVMAHEFSHYEGAMGPEGKRRTTTHYGPVVGGLPISAWHCEACGLLRLTYPDGRLEERRLYPGPQPGLLALPAPLDPDATFYGMQARVSGLSASRDIEPILIRELPSEEPYQWPEIPDLGPLTWTTIGLLALTVVGLFGTAIMATAGYNTDPGIGGWIAVTAWSFGLAVALQAAAAGFRHAFPMPELGPSVAVSQRGVPALTNADRTVVSLLGGTLLFLFIDAVLATYDYNTSTLMLPAVIVTVLLFVAAVITAIVGSLVRNSSKP